MAKKKIIFTNDKINKILKDFEDKMERIYNKNIVISDINIINQQDTGISRCEEEGEFIIASQWNTLIELMEELPKNQQLDFTYDTIKNTTYVFKKFIQKIMLKNSELKDNNNNYWFLFMTTIAGYWYGLGINEHNCSIQTRIGNGKNPPYWGDKKISIRIGTIEKIDFLHYTPEMFPPFESDEYIEIRFDFKPIINAYNKAFGVNLKDYGMEEIISIKI